MIRALAALTRQTQEFFHTYLVGIYSWEEVRFTPPEKQAKPEPSFNARGRKRRAERPEGKYHPVLVLEFGIWRLKVESPVEHPPVGWITLDADETLEGPLDAATWRRLGEYIRKQEEIKNVA